MDIETILDELDDAQMAIVACHVAKWFELKGRSAAEAVQMELDDEGDFAECAQWFQDIADGKMKDE